MQKSPIRFWSAWAEAGNPSLSASLRALSYVRQPLGVGIVIYFRALPDALLQLLPWQSTVLSKSPGLLPRPICIVGSVWDTCGCTGPSTNHMSRIASAAKTLRSEAVVLRYISPE